MKRSWVLPALASVLLAANAHGSFMSLLGVDDSVAQLGSEVRVAVSHARKEAQILIADGNAAAKQRLSQIDEIVDEALDDISDLENKTSEDVQRILTKVKADIGEIESKLIADLNDLVWKAECGGKRILIQDSKSALGGFGSLLGTHKIVVTPALPPRPETRSLWCREISCTDEQKFQIREPFDHTYIEIREYMLTTLDDRLEVDSPAHAIVGTYDYLSSLALRASCFHEGGSTQFAREHVKWKVKSEHWTNILSIEVNR